MRTRETSWGSVRGAGPWGRPHGTLGPPPPYKYSCILPPLNRNPFPPAPTLSLPSPQTLMSLPTRCRRRSCRPSASPWAPPCPCCRPRCVAHCVGLGWQAGSGWFRRAGHADSLLAAAQPAALPPCPPQFISDAQVRLACLAGATTLGLCFFGFLGAFLGGACVFRGGMRVVLGGWMALGIVYGIGRLLNVDVA